MNHPRLRSQFRYEVDGNFFPAIQEVATGWSAIQAFYARLYSKPPVVDPSSTNQKDTKPPVERNKKTIYVNNVNYTKRLFMKERAISAGLLNNIRPQQRNSVR